MLIINELYDIILSIYGFLIDYSKEIIFCIFSGIGIPIFHKIFKNDSKNMKLSNVKIVDLSFYTCEDGVLIADIKLRNIGEQVAFLKKVSFDILDYYNMDNPQIVCYSLVESSNTYDIILDKDKRKVFNISHKICLNDVDRLFLKLSSSIADINMVTIYYLTVSFIYDEDNKVTKSEKYILPVPSNKKFSARYIADINKKIAKQNYLMLKKMNTYEAIKTQEFVNILNSYEENKSDFM